MKLMSVTGSEGSTGFTGSTNSTGSAGSTVSKGFTGFEGHLRKIVLSVETNFQQQETQRSTYMMFPPSCGLFEDCVNAV